MTELTVQGIFETSPGVFEQATLMRIWCVECGKVHSIPLENVEKLVHVLSRLAVQETNGGFEDQGPDCLEEMLPDLMGYADDVEDAITKRKVE